MISPGSHLALIFASLIVSASGDPMVVDRAASQRLSVVRLKFGQAERQAWIRAINNDRVDQLSLMLGQHDARQLSKLTAANGKSALMAACKKGDIVLARQLVQAGAEINEQTLTQGTPLMFAVLGGQLAVAQWLHNQGADLHQAGSNGWTAVTLAAAKGYVDILQWLVEQGADAQARDVYRFTPLSRAVENGFEDVVAYLLSLPDTDPNATDEYGNSALHHAVSSGRQDMIRLLLDRGADPRLANRDGMTPYAMDAQWQELFDRR